MSNTLYHNPRCSKSRIAKQLLEEAGIQFEIKEYLKEGLSQKEIKDLKAALGLKVIEFMRVKESVFKDLKLKEASEKELISAMAENPILLERPIFLKAQKAALGRPPEKVLEI
ncbi:MAG: arsenate reductase (glutaredoxin) [Bdellovibrionota bacterium]|nr:arsenate reductase (glutaredoxin) [Bdellovibrionota bacterium]